KLVTPDLISPESAERFKREARVVAKMDHPSIVSVYDSGEEEGSLFFVMPYVEGKNLRSLLLTQSLTLGELVEVASQAASALDYSHSRSIIHRDIKPENIMIDVESRPGLGSAGRASNLRVRITDFGLALSPKQDRIT